MSNRIKAIPTVYNNVQMRSRLEAKVATELDRLGIEWMYEAEGYDLDGIWYLPDFWLPEERAFLEVKGIIDDSVDKTRALAAAVPADVRVFLIDGNMQLWQLLPDGSDRRVQFEIFETNISVRVALFALLRTECTKLRKSTRPKAVFKGMALQSVLDGESVQDIAILAEAALAMIRAAPEITSSLFAAMMVTSASPMPLADLVELIDAAKEHIRDEARPGGGARWEPEDEGWFAKMHAEECLLETPLGSSLQRFISEMEIDLSIDEICSELNFCCDYKLMIRVLWSLGCSLLNFDCRDMFGSGSGHRMGQAVVRPNRKLQYEYSIERELVLRGWSREERRLHREKQSRP